MVKLTHSPSPANCWHAHGVAPPSSPDGMWRRPRARADLRALTRRAVRDAPIPRHDPREHRKRLHRRVRRLSADLQRAHRQPPARDPRLGAVYRLADAVQRTAVPRDLPLGPGGLDTAGPAHAPAGRYPVPACRRLLPQPGGLDAPRQCDGATWGVRRRRRFRGRFRQPAARDGFRDVHRAIATLLVALAVAPLLWGGGGAPRGGVRGTALFRGGPPDHGPQVIQAGTKPHTETAPTGRLPCTRLRAGALHVCGPP